MRNRLALRQIGHVRCFTVFFWFDGALPRGQIRQYLASAHPGSRLRLGPWFHAGQFNASGRHDEFDHARELIRFFDAHLRGMDETFRDEAPVHYFTMGEERWKTAPAWPPPGATSRSFYLSGNRSLAAEPTAAAGEAEDRYEVDEAVTSGPGSRWGLIVGTGARRGYRDRGDRAQRLLTYTTAPLEDDLEVTGHPVLRLFLSANATDGAVFAHLEDVQPGGSVRYVSEGQLRLLHRRTRPSPFTGDPALFRSFLRADAHPLVPGETVRADIDLLPTSYIFRAGHAIRLAIAGADAGTFDAPLPAAPLIYDVHRDAAHPSCLDLPTYR